MSLDPVLMNIMQRTLPVVLAHDILHGGATEKSMEIEDGMNILRGLPGRVLMTKVHHGHFAKVYNRRKRHHPEYIDSLGYFRVRISTANVMNARRWCKANLTDGSYVISLIDFWFAAEKDYLIFAMRWGGRS